MQAIEFIYQVHTARGIYASMNNINFKGQTTMTTEELKMVFIWIASILMLIYWFVVFYNGYHFISIFELSITFLVVEKAVWMWEKICSKQCTIEENNQF